MGVVGSSVRRLDGEAKVTGAAVYCLDYEEPRMLHAKLLALADARRPDRPP